MLFQLLLTFAMAMVSQTAPMFTFTAGSVIYGAAMFTYSFLLLFYLADWMDNRIPFRVSNLPIMLAGFVANMIVGIFNQLVGLMRWRDQQHWVKTAHAIEAENVAERNIMTIPQKIG